MAATSAEKLERWKSVITDCKQLFLVHEVRDKLQQTAAHIPLTYDEAATLLASEDTGPEERRQLLRIFRPPGGKHAQAVVEYVVSIGDVDAFDIIFPDDADIATYETDKHLLTTIAALAGDPRMLSRLLDVVGEYDTDETRKKLEHLRRRINAAPRVLNKKKLLGVINFHIATLVVRFPDIKAAERPVQDSIKE